MPSATGSTSGAAGTLGTGQTTLPYQVAGYAMQPIAYMLVPIMAMPAGTASTTTQTAAGTTSQTAAGTTSQTAAGTTSQTAASGTTQTAATQSTALEMPFDGTYPVTQGFGPTDFTAEPSYEGYAHFHTGIDFGLPQGTDVKAAGSGKVIAAGWTDDGFGNEVIVDHGNGVVSLYGHLSAVDTKVGDTVQAGQEIGLSGSTGNSTGPHLHFGVEVNGQWVDPTPYIHGSAAASTSATQATQTTPTQTTPLPIVPAQAQQEAGTAGTTTAGTTMSATTPIYVMPIMPMLQSYGGVQMMPVQIGSSAGYGYTTQVGQAASSSSGTVQPSTSSAGTSQQATSGVGGGAASPAGTAASSSTESLATMIDQAAQTSGVPASLLAAVVQTESGGDPNAVSSAGAKGLMQLMDSTASAYGVTDSLDPQQNLAGGSKFLRSLLTQYSGNEQLALAAYNAGPGAVSAYGGVPPYTETQNYVQKVLQLQQQFNSSGQL